MATISDDSSVILRRPAVELLESRRLLSVGALDTSFGGTGYVLSSSQASGEIPYFSTGEGLAELANGQTLVAGQVSIGNVNGIYVRRFDSDGTVDSSFGSGAGYEGANGYSFIGGTLFPDPSDIAGSNYPAVARLATDSSGDIFVAEADAGVVRLSSSGTVDQSFGDSGFAPVAGLVDIAVLSNSELLVTTMSGKLDRLLTSGALDTTFGTSGSVTLPVVPGEFMGSQAMVQMPAQLPIAIQPDGKILVGGQDSSGDMAIVRLTSGGSIDSTFGVDGLASVSFGYTDDEQTGQPEYNPSYVSALAVLASGDIVVGGGVYIQPPDLSPEAFGMAEFLSNGSLNKACADGGDTYIYTSGSADTFTGSYVAAVLPESNGNIFFAGSSFDLGNPAESDEGSFFLLCARSSGVLDSLFGTAGEVTTQFSVPQSDNDGPTDVMYAALNTPDDKVMAVGDAAPNDQGLNSSFVLARYIVEAVPTLTLDASSNATAVGEAVTLTAQVSGAAATPTGTVTFLDNGAAIGTSALDSEGDASLQTSRLPAGYNTLTATYSGDTNYLASSSSPVIVTVNLLPSVTNLSALAKKLIVGQPDTFRVTVASASGGGPIPTGDVTILQDGVAVGTYPLQADGEVTETNPGPSAATQNQFTASYSGDANYAASNSSAISQLYLEASAAVPSLIDAVIPAAGIAGQRINAHVPVKIENTGAPLQGRFTISLYLDKASEGLDGSQTELKSTTEKMALRAGKSVVLPFAVRALPASLAVGNYHFVTEITDPLGDSNIVTSAQTVTISRPYVALSATTGQITPSTLGPGGSGILVISITETGNVAARGTLDIAVIAADPSESATQLALAEFKHPAAIAPGLTGRYRLRIAISKTAAPGEVDPVITVTLAGTSAIVNAAISLGIG